MSPPSTLAPAAFRGAEGNPSWSMPPMQALPLLIVKSASMTRGYAAPQLDRFFAGTSRSRRLGDLIRKPPSISPRRAGRLVTSRSPSATPARHRACARIPGRAAHRHSCCKWLREATYASLSTIARAITGTNWNGPRFFGLRIDKETTISPDADPPPRFPNGGTLAQAGGSKSRRAVAIERPSGNATPAHLSLDDAVKGEPVSGQNSLLTGKRAGNF